jgi:hypothetical protein
VENRLVLYLDVRRAPSRDYQIWIHAYTPGTDRRVTDAIVPTTPTHEWRPGRRVESRVLHLRPGEYDLRAGFWQPAGGARLCPNGRTDACYLLLGTHRLDP